MLRSDCPVIFFLLVGLVGCDANVPRRPGSNADLRSLGVVDGGPGPTFDRGLAPATDLGLAPRADFASAPRADVTPAPPRPDSGPIVPPRADAGSSAGYDYRKSITWHSISSSGKSCDAKRYGPYYCDVMGHTKSPYLSSDTMTNVHESQHFMAHENDRATAASDKFIYFRGGKGAFFPEPNLKTSGIVSSITFKGTTYNTYIASRPSQSLGENIVDEWRAYLTEEIAAIEIAAGKGQTSGINGLVLGGVEYLYYNAAMLHALQTKEPNFLAQYPQAKAVFAMLAEETIAWTVDRGVKKGLFFSLTNAKAQSTLTNLATAASQAHIRGTLRSLYGSAWTSRVLGFK